MGLIDQKLQERLRKIIVHFHGEGRGSQQEFALRCGASEPTVAKWLSGSERSYLSPSANYRAKICATYGIRRRWLDSGDGDMLAGAPPGERKAPDAHPRTEPGLPVTDTEWLIRYRALYEESDKKFTTLSHDISTAMAQNAQALARSAEALSHHKCTDAQRAKTAGARESLPRKANVQSVRNVQTIPDDDSKKPRPIHQNAQP